MSSSKITSTIIGKVHITRVWSAALNSVCSVAFVQSSLSKAGLEPFNPGAIDRKTLKKSTVTQVEQPQAQLCPTCGRMEEVCTIPSAELHAEG